MIHYSCDRCQRRIDSLEEIRYIVRIEIQATIDSAEPADEGDHLMEIEEILERLEEADCQELSEDVYQNRQFDLCPQCYQEYKKNPLALDAPVTFDFSQN
ncbi:MAG: hypothetical protein MK108_01155 [Mariniblastus sp.]|nr:hypothetical protein [Mariniblastus sp.]